MDRRSAFMLAVLAAGVLAGLAVMFVGCAPTAPRPMADESVYARVPTAPTPARAVRPLAERVRLEAEPDLAAYLDAVTAVVERRDWQALARLADERAFLEQLAFLTASGVVSDVAAAQTLESVLGLGMAGTAVFPDGADRVAAPFAGLDRIRTLTLERATPARDAVTVEGTADLGAGETRPVTLVVLPTERGYRLAVAMG